MQQYLEKLATWMLFLAAVRAFDLVLKPRPPRWRDVAMAVGIAVALFFAAAIVGAMWPVPGLVPAAP